MKIGLYTRYLSPAFHDELQQLASALHRRQVDTEEVGTSLATDDYDFLFSIGGDGTLLSAVHLIAGRPIPVVGINFGHLGFLTTVGRDDFDLLVDDLLAGRYTVEPRTLLHVEVQKALTHSSVSRADSSPNLGEQPEIQLAADIASDCGSHSSPKLGEVAQRAGGVCQSAALKGLSLSALNEVSLHRIDDTNLLRTDLYVDNDFVASYDGDGLLVATPTGSTAYSLSCGGPILTPDCGCFVVTPIAVHNLSLRPIIVPDSATLRLVTAPDSNVNLGTDSRHLTLAGGSEIVLTREPFTVRLVRLRDQNFFSAIQQKLNWGGTREAPARYTREIS